MRFLTRIENFILSRLLNAPVHQNILRWNGRHFHVGSRELSDAETQNLIVSASALTHNEFWKYLIAELEREGQKRIGASSKQWEDVRFGKACLYIADLAKQKAAAAAKLPLPKPRPKP